MTQTDTDVEKSGQSRLENDLQWVLDIDVSLPEGKQWNTVANRSTCQEKAAGATYKKHEKEA